MFSRIHESWFLVWFAIGIIAGVILGVILNIDFFVSPLFFVLSGILFAICLLRPMAWLIFLAFLGGCLMGITRYSCAAPEEQAVSDVLGLSQTTQIVRDWFAGRLENAIPAPEVKLGTSYLLGMKADLPKDLSENLRAVGLAHIVVASGAHLAILVDVAKKIFGRISRFAGLLFSVLFIVLFMAMVGFTPSILRAGIMTILNLSAWYVGRKIAPWRIILLTAAGTLVINPNFITDLGWLLSFASFIGIMMLAPKILEFFYGNQKPNFVASTILTTISATLTTLPIVLYYFGQISLISVFANLLILPTLPYAMGLTFLSGFFVGIPIIGGVVSFVTIKLLDFHIFVVELFGSFTPFLIKIPPYQIWVFLLYIPIVLLLLIGHVKRKVVKLKQVNKILE